MKHIHVTSRAPENHSPQEFHMIRRRKDGGFAYARRPRALYTYLMALGSRARSVTRRAANGAYDFVPQVRTSPDPHEAPVVEAAQLVPGA